MDRKNCRHLHLGFASGGFYVRCADCEHLWESTIPGGFLHNGLTIHDVREALPSELGDAGLSIYPVGDGSRLIQLAFTLDEDDAVDTVFDWLERLIGLASDPRHTG